MNQATLLTFYYVGRINSHNVVRITYYSRRSSEA